VFPNVNTVDSNYPIRGVKWEHELLLIFDTIGGYDVGGYHGSFGKDANNGQEKGGYFDFTTSRGNPKERNEPQPDRGKVWRRSKSAISVHAKSARDHFEDSRGGL
jgi:hypothetical protein